MTVIYVSPNSDTQPTGPVTWQSESTAIATVDAGGRVAGVSRGVTFIRATANGVTTQALAVVTDTLQATLLLDTIYLMTGDTFTVPVEVRSRGGLAPPAWFEINAVGQVDIDSASGRLTANGNGGYFPFIAHAGTAIPDTGWVQVVNAIDTTTANSRAYFTIFGTVIRRNNGQAVGMNYRVTNGSRAFRLTVSIVRQFQTIENVVITLPDSFADPGVFSVNGIQPDEVGDVAAVCQPAGSWGLWASLLFTPALNAVSHPGGELIVTQKRAVPGGFVLSGRFQFDTQRLDMYDDPAGLLPIRGTFVAPLVANTSTCQ
jgi:hypothetical protein